MLATVTMVWLYNMLFKKTSRMHYHINVKCKFPCYYYLPIRRNQTSAQPRICPPVRLHAEDGHVETRAVLRCRTRNGRGVIFVNPCRPSCQRLLGIFVVLRMMEVKAGRNGLPHGSIDVTTHESMGHREGFRGNAECITFLVL